MKNLTEYVVSEQLFTTNEDGDTILCEGFWDKLGGILGKGVAKVKTAMSNFSQAFSNALTTANVVAAQTKDSDLKKMIGNLNDKLSNATSEKEAITLLKAEADKVLTAIKRDKIQTPDYAISLKHVLKAVEGDPECTELAEKLSKAIDKKFSTDAEKVEKKVEATEKKVKKSDIVPSEKKSNKKDKDDKKDKDTKKAKGKATIGADEEDATVTKKQEKNAVQNEIKEDKTFFETIAKNAELDAVILRDSIVGLINNALKEEVVERDGKTVFKWKKDTKGFQSKNEDKLIKGLASIFCGLAMINHKAINEQVLEILISTGFSRKDYINNLVKNNKK